MQVSVIAAAVLAAISCAMPAGVMAQQAASIDRIKITDGEASCLQLHTEAGEMDKIAAEARSAQEKSGTTATAAGAANVAAEVAGRTGGFFGAFGSVLGGIVGQAATQTAANVAQQSARQSAQQSGERIKQAQARKEHLTSLFLAKGCRSSDLTAQAKPLSAEELNRLASLQTPGTATGETASAPLAVDVPDLAPREFMRPLDSWVTQEVQKNRRVAIGGFRVAFVTKAVAADSIRASYLGGGVHNSGVNSQVEMTLRNVDLQRMQALTERAYREFMAQLKDTGLEVIPYERFAQHKSFAEISFAGKGDGNPYTTDTGGRTYTVLSPAGMKLWFGQAEALGDQGAFGAGNGFKVGEFAFENKLAVLNPMLVVDFAETSAGRNKGIFGFRNRTDVKVQSAISLRAGAGMTQLMFVARSAPIATAIAYGASPLSEPVMFSGEIGKLENREQSTNRGLVAGLGALGLSGGPVREVQKDDLVADPARYEALAGGVLVAGSRLFARTLAEVLKP